MGSGKWEENPDSLLPIPYSSIWDDYLIAGMLVITPVLRRRVKKSANRQQE